MCKQLGSSTALAIPTLVLLAVTLQAQPLSDDCTPTWTGLDGGLRKLGDTGYNIQVEAMAWFDDGSGLALYVGGDFDTAGNTPAPFVARWTGKEWTSVGGGMNGPVKALYVFDDGSGPALYAGGLFTVAGETAASGIARWKNQQWQAVGGGVSGIGTDQSALVAPAVYTMTSYQGKLLVGGAFRQAGDVEVTGLAAWNGSQWESLNLEIGVSEFPYMEAIFALQTTAELTGSEQLFVGGFFQTLAGQPATHAAVYDGIGWTALPVLPGSAVNQWLVFNDFAVREIGGHPRLLAAVLRNTPVVQLAGNKWQPLSNGFFASNFNRGHRFVDLPGQRGLELHVMGQLRFSPGGLAKGLARFDGELWTDATPTGMKYTGVDAIRAAAIAPNESPWNHEVYLAGSFFEIDDIMRWGVAKFACESADVNQDGCIDDRDLGLVLSAMQISCHSLLCVNPADVNNDGVVTSLDLGLLLDQYGQGCE